MQVKNFINLHEQLAYFIFTQKVKILLSPNAFGIRMAARGH